MAYILAQMASFAGRAVIGYLGHLMKLTHITAHFTLDVLFYF